jgi:hypothetical protein
VKIVNPKPRLKSRKTAVARKEDVSPKFWIRPASRELNRTGDFILKELPRIRQEAASRAGVA